MKPKTARRFLSRNTWKIAARKISFQSPSFWTKVKNCRKVLDEVAYKSLSVDGRIYHMLGF